MRFSTLASLALFTGAANAHFRLFYPGPRGPFNAPEQLNFCSGYTEATSNRTDFPLSGGFFNIRQGHPNWAAAVLISTEDNANSFDDFNGTDGQQFAHYWSNAQDVGNLCIPLDLSNTGISGVRAGANVTIQIAISGGDGNLFQCADLTLRENYTIPEDVATCRNTSIETTTGAHATETAASGSDTNGALSSTHQISGFTAILLAVGGSVLAMI